MARARRQVGLTVAVTATIAATLCGCTAKPHVSARLENGAPAFAVCDAVRSNEIVVEVKPKTPVDSKFVSIWTADGGSQLRANQIISLGHPPSGFKSTATVDDVDFKKQTIYFGADYIGSDGSLRSSEQGVFEGSKLRKSSWLNWDGNYTSQPC